MTSDGIRDAGYGSREPGAGKRTVSRKPQAISRKPLRILHLIYDDVGNPWLGGGGALRTREINSRLVEMGHDVTVLCGIYSGAAASETVAGVKYRRVGWPGWLARRSYMGSRVAFVLAALVLLKQIPYDIVVEDVSPYSPIFSPLLRRAGSRAIASVQNLSGRHAVGKFGVSLRGLLPLLIERPLLRRFSYAVAVSPGIAGQMAAWWGRSRGGRGRRLVVIPNSVGAEYLSAAGDAAEQPFILFLGRIDIYQKGLDRLIAAYALAARHMQGVGLVIAGGGAVEDEQQLVTLIRQAGLRLVRGHVECATGTVSWLGRVAGAAGAALLGQCLFMALPSRYEAWPIVALEAAACGKALLGADIVGVRDAAPPTAHGFLIKASGAVPLAAAMVRLADSADLRHKLGARGRAWAAQFDWDMLARRQADFYYSVLDRSKSAATAI